MSWRAAKAITRLRGQVNAAYPHRAKGDDGIIGDASHSARTSDHNPNGAGVVCAIDFTDEHGGTGKFEAKVLAEAIKDDPRVHYVIHDRMIYTHDVARRWRPYTGSNPHDVHVHISMHQEARLYDDARPFAYPKEAPKVKDTSWAIPLQDLGNNSDRPDKVVAAAKAAGSAALLVQVPRAPQGGAQARLTRLAAIIHAYLYNSAARAGIDKLVK